MCRLAAVHAPPGGFWKNSRNANNTKNSIVHNSNMIQNSSSYEITINNTSRTPLTWIFLSFALTLASFPLTTNVFLLLSLKTALKLHSKLTQNPPIRALYCTHTDNLTKPFLLLLISFLLSS